MYLTHYGLQKKPFEISPDPNFQWFGEQHKEALALMKCGIVNSNGFIVITGDVGTGKTALIKRFVKMAKFSVWVVTIPDPDMSRQDLYNFLAAEFKMGRTFQSKGEFLIHFKHFLLSAHQARKKILLIIDEAQRLSHELLEEIRLLSTIDFDGRMLLNIFFIGQNEFKTFLMEEKNRAISNRVTASYQIEPLTEKEVFSYMSHRLRVAGGSVNIFTQLAVRKIYSFSAGNPRAVNIICDCALLSGYVKDTKRIESSIIEECANELDFTIEKYRVKKDQNQSSGRQPVSAVEIAKAFIGNAFFKQEVFRSTPVVVTFILILGFFIYLMSDSFLDHFQSRKNYRTATYKQDYTPLMQEARELNVYSGDQPKKSGADSAAEDVELNGRLPEKPPPLKGINLGLDTASSFRTPLPDHHTTSEKE